jgi:hypothetical protein
MQKKIFLSAADLANTRQSIRVLLDALEHSDLGASTEITVCHTRDFSWDLVSELAHYDLDLKFLDTGYSTDHYEYPALHELWLESQKSDFQVLYLHTKGASKITIPEQRNALAWQKFMLHGVLDNWKICEQHLDAGADLVGALWYWHFKGNFWWARSDYLRTLTDPILMDHDYRNHAEFWCAWGNWWGRHAPPRVKNLFYLDGYEKDTDFLDLEKQYKNSMPSVHKYLAFTASELLPESELSQTLEEFLNSGDYRMFDEFRITTKSLNQIQRIKLHLSYAGRICVYDAGTRNLKQVITYQEI